MDYLLEVERQAYLDSFLSLCSDAVSSIVYDPKSVHSQIYFEKLIHEGFFEEENIHLNPLERVSMGLIISGKLIGKREKHPIFVREYPFTNLKQNQFVSCILDHEYIHARQFKEGIFIDEEIHIDYANENKISGRGLKCIFEILAYRSQLSCISSRGIFPKTNDEDYCFAWNLKKWEEAYSRSLQAQVPKSKLEYQIRKILLKT